MTREFININFEPQFIEKINQHHEIAEYILLDNEQKVFKSQKRIPKVLKEPISFERDNTQEHIKLVRMVIIMHKVSKQKRLHNHVEWSIICEREFNGSYNYSPIAEELIQVIVNGLMNGPTTHEWIEACRNIFEREHKTKTRDSDHFIDVKDKDFESQNIKFGHYGVKIPYYVNVEHLEYYSRNAQGLISSISYRPIEQKFNGLTQYPDGRVVKEPLSDEWVKENFPDEMYDYFKNNSDTKVRYLNVPPGDTNTIPLQFIKSSNPVIKYQQNEEKTCAFSSMSSTLHYLGYTKLATQLQLFKETFYQEQFRHAPDKVLQSIVSFVTGTKKEYQFTPKYACKKISSNIDVLRHEYVKGDFFW